jgi:hypothetical protein
MVRFQVEQMPPDGVSIVYTFDDAPVESRPGTWGLYNLNENSGARAAPPTLSSIGSV